MQNCLNFSLPHHAACGILFPWPGVEPVPLALEVQSLNHWTAREVLCRTSGNELNSEDREYMHKYRYSKGMCMKCHVLRICNTELWAGKKRKQFSLRIMLKKNFRSKHFMKEEKNVSIVWMNNLKIHRQCQGLKVLHRPFLFGRLPLFPKSLPSWSHQILPARLHWGRWQEILTFKSSRVTWKNIFVNLPASEFFYTYENLSSKINIPGSSDFYRAHKLRLTGQTWPCCLFLHSPWAKNGFHIWKLTGEKPEEEKHLLSNETDMKFIFQCPWIKFYWNRATITHFGMVYGGFWGFPGGSVIKNLPANAGDARDMGLITGSERSPKEGNGNHQLQCSCLENLMDREAWRAIVHGVTKGQTGLSDWVHTHTHTHTHTVASALQWQRQYVWQCLTHFLSDPFQLKLADLWFKS